MTVNNFMKEYFEEKDYPSINENGYISPDGKFVSLREKGYTHFSKLEKLLKKQGFPKTQINDYANRNIYVCSCIDKQNKCGQAWVRAYYMTPTNEQYNTIALWLKQLSYVKRINLLLLNGVDLNIVSSKKTLINDIKLNYGVRDYKGLIYGRFNGEVSFSNGFYTNFANRLIVNNDNTTINFCIKHQFGIYEVTTLCKLFNIPNRPIVKFEEWGNYTQGKQQTLTKKTYSLEEYLKKEYPDSWNDALQLLNSELDKLY